MSKYIPGASAPAPQQAPAKQQPHTEPHGSLDTHASEPAKPSWDSTTAQPTTPAKKINQKAVDGTANEIFKKMDGWWVSSSDRSSILDSLRGKSPEEISAIRKSYAEQKPGHDLDADLGKNLSGKDLAEAKASLHGDRVAAAVTAIRNAETGTFFGNLDPTRVHDIINGIDDPKVRAEVAKQVAGELGKQEQGNDKELTQALLAGDKAKVSGIQLQKTLHGGLLGGGGYLGTGFGQDKEEIYKSLGQVKDDKQRAEMLDAYQKAGGGDLRKDLHKNLTGANAKDTTGSEDVAVKLLEGDKNAANAARIKAATEGWFTDKSAIYKALEVKDDNDRKELLADYNKMYGKKGGDLDTMLQKNLSDLDLEKAKKLKDKGELDDAFAVKYALDRSFWTTDKAVIKERLAGKSKAEIDALTKEYQTKYKIDLTKELPTSGRDGFEIQELMKGEPQTVDDKVARARDRYDFERGSGSNFVSKSVMDTFSDKGKLLDQQQKRLEDLYTQIKNGQGSKDQKELLDRVTGYQSLDTQNYQESKDSVTNGAVAVATITAGAAATIATGGAATPAAAAMMAAVTGGAGIGTRWTMQGAGYSNEQLRNDVIMTGLSAASGGVASALTPAAEEGVAIYKAGKFLGGPLTESLTRQATQGAIQSGVSSATGAWLGGGDATTVLQKTMSAGGMGALSGGLGSWVTGGLTDRIKSQIKGMESVQAMGPMKEAMFRNAIAGGAGAAAGSTLDPGVWKDPSTLFTDPTKLLQSVAGGMVGGAAGGAIEGKRTIWKQQREAMTAARLPIAPDEDFSLQQMQHIRAHNDATAAAEKAVDKMRRPLFARESTWEQQKDAVYEKAYQRELVEARGRARVETELPQLTGEMSRVGSRMSHEEIERAQAGEKVPVGPGYAGYTMPDGTSAVSFRPFSDGELGTTLSVIQRMESNPETAGLMPKILGHHKEDGQLRIVMEAFKERLESNQFHTQTPEVQGRLQQALTPDFLEQVRKTGLNQSRQFENDYLFNQEGNLRMGLPVRVSEFSADLERMFAVKPEGGSSAPTQTSTAPTTTPTTTTATAAPTTTTTTGGSQHVSPTTTVAPTPSETPPAKKPNDDPVKPVSPPAPAKEHDSE